MSEAAVVDAILLIGFGGPTRREEIRPFLDSILRGRAVPQQRYEEVVHHYEVMGGRSPYNEHTTRQADALRARLRSEGIAIPVMAAMRNWEPYIADAIGELAAKGARRVFGFILAAHRCEASWERYQGAVDDARAKLGARAPQFEYPRPWHTHPKFIEAVAARAAAAIAQLDSADREHAELIFTAHSIPAAMDETSGYARQVRESAQLAAAKLGRDSWTLAFQSRSGSPRDRWLEPEIAAVLRKLGGRAAIVVPIGFLCDHVEVLYDLDVEAAAIARSAGVRMVRAATVGDHPAFIEMIAELMREPMET